MISFYVDPLRLFIEMLEYLVYSNTSQQRTNSVTNDKIDIKKMIYYRFDIVTKFFREYSFEIKENQV